MAEESRQAPPDLSVRVAVFWAPVSRGQRRVHPGVGEIRQHRMALARLLRAVALPAEDQSESWATKNARAAAQARWSREAR
jgi:hypothetical protein